MPALDRRDFNAKLIGSFLTFNLIETLWTRDLFAADVKPDVGNWFRDLNALGQDLKGQKLKDTEFQAKLEELYKKVDLPSLLQFVELDKLAGDPVDVYVNDRPVARGEVLVLNDNFCVRINEILSQMPAQPS